MQQSDSTDLPIAKKHSKAPAINSYRTPKTNRRKRQERPEDTPSVSLSHIFASSHVFWMLNAEPG